MGAGWNAEQGGECARQCRAELARFLTAMARQIARQGPGGDGERLLETRFLGESYSLTLVCCSCGLRRFMAFMEEPYAETFALGRLRRDGSAQVYEHGVRLFLGYLLHQGLFTDFRRDLTESLKLCATQHAAKERLL